MMYTISFYIGPRYKGTRLYILEMQTIASFCIATK